MNFKQCTIDRNICCSICGISNYFHTTPISKCTNFSTFEIPNAQCTNAANSCPSDVQSSDCRQQGFQQGDRNTQDNTFANQFSNIDANIDINFE
jgi:hypothetical protein